MVGGVEDICVGSFRADSREMGCFVFIFVFLLPTPALTGKTVDTGCYYGTIKARLAL